MTTIEARASGATITFRVPHLADESCRVQWLDHGVDYVCGRSLAGYLLNLGIESEQLLSVEMDGDEAAVDALDSYFPRRGATVKIIPQVGGKNTSLILGVIGAIIGGVAGWELGYGAAAAGSVSAAAQGAFLGNATDEPAPMLGLQRPDPIRMLPIVSERDQEILSAILTADHGWRFSTIHAYGDSMEPTLHDGDVLIIDTERPPHEGEIAVVRFPRRERNVCGRVRTPGGSLFLSKDNTDYPIIPLSEYLPAILTARVNEPEPWHLIGRVIAFVRARPVTDFIGWLSIAGSAVTPS